MSSSSTVATLLAVLIIPCLFAYDEDLQFETSDEVELKYFPDPNTQWDGNSNKLTAVVGRDFHFTLPRDKFGNNVHSFEAKQQGDKLLPPWLLFDKTDGILWGVPLSNDVDTLTLIIRTAGSDKTISQEYEIHVVEPGSYPDVMGKCPPEEDNTILTLLIDRGVQAIKPKQRVIAINNIAKFLGMPYSAFTFKPETQPDDITDSSVLLAGPGNLVSRASKATALLEVPVGCDGRLWMTTAPIVHQLKQQARDGTISEVLRLPLVGWRVKTETKPIIRSKRQTDDNSYGSGDYEYYDDYDYGDEFDEDSETTAQATTPTTPTAAPTTANTATTTTTAAATLIPASSSTHHHRHHHGESKLNESSFSVPGHRQTHTSPRIFDSEDVTPPLSPETESPTTVSTTTTTTTTEVPAQPKATLPTQPIEEESQHFTTIVTTTTTRTTTAPISSRTEAQETTTRNVDDAYDFYDEYDTNDYADGDVESETVVPAVRVGQSEGEVAGRGEVATESTTTDQPIQKTTIKDIQETTTFSPTPAHKTESTLFFFEEDREEVGEEETPIETTVTTEESTVPYHQYSAAVTSTVLPTIIPEDIPPSTIPSTTTTTTTTTDAPTTIPEETITEDRSTTTVKVTTLRHIVTSPRTTTVAREITETIEYDVKNFPPYIENRLPQKSVIAGQLLQYTIPRNTFKDFEDKFNLVIQVLDSNGIPLGQDSWLQYNSLKREVYGLPLNKDISRWRYIVRATDTGGKFCDDTLLVHVQQHKAERTVNHEFSMQIRIEKHSEYPHYVDWSMQVLRALGKIYDGTDPIIVRSINYSSDDPAIFTWTNDTVPKNFCPNAEIKNLYQMLTANEYGDPIQELSSMLLHQGLRVKKLSYTGLGVCEVPHPAPPTPPKNFSPVIRNHVDIIKGTVGELLIFRVPEDTFYDPEQTDSRLLNITLLTANRQPIPPANWLQFDSKNREFYGIPWKNGTTEYQLVCFDRAGLSATDSLVVDIKYPPRTHYNVEFSMEIEASYHTFNNSDMQRKFVEKLSQLFGDQNTSNILLLPFKAKRSSTIVTWYNKTLTRDECPHEEIGRLESLVKTPDREIRPRVHNIMEFNIPLIQIIPHGKCKIQKPKVPIRPDIIEKVNVPPTDEHMPQSSSDEYLVTFIVPAVIIAIMLFLAAIAACILYRKRRSGKMNLEEDGRQSYGNKGIPVIFQEELEEKPEAGTKTPVILKDEKPPLAPPEYSKSGSLKLNDDSEPYQPPPPFTRTQDNNRQSRPKPTPTYRKPPPYVPP